MMNGCGQSDGCIVPTKSPNKPKGAEGMEGRRPAKGNEHQGHISRTQGRSKDMSQALERIRLAVRRADGQASAPRQEPDAVTPHVRFSEGGAAPRAIPTLTRPPLASWRGDSPLPRLLPYLSSPGPTRSGLA